MAPRFSALSMATVMYPGDEQSTVAAQLWVAPAGPKALPLICRLYPFNTGLWLPTEVPTFKAHREDADNTDSGLKPGMVACLLDDPGLPSAMTMWPTTDQTPHPVLHIL